MSILPKSGAFLVVKGCGVITGLIGIHTHGDRHRLNERWLGRFYKILPFLYKERCNIIYTDNYYRGYWSNMLGAWENCV